MSIDVMAHNGPAQVTC